MRVGLGPVFACEWLTGSRRWQVYAGRSAFVALLLVALTFVWVTELGRRPATTIRAQAEVGQSIYFTIAVTQIALVLLAAPGVTAGSICLDKARGTLAHVLVTDLSDAEIVLGKLAARLVPTLGLVLCTLPFMAITTLLGGVDPRALLGAFLVTVGVAVLGAAVALTCSVWATKTHEALMATFLVWMLWLLSAPGWSMLSRGGGLPVQPPEFLKQINPFWLVLDVSPGRLDLTPMVAFLAGCLAISAVLAAFSTFRLRRVALRQTSRASEPKRKAKGAGIVSLSKGAEPEAVAASRGWPGTRLGLRWSRLFEPLGPPLDGNPVLWWEWHRSRPSRWTRVIWLAYVATAVVFSGLAIHNSLFGSRRAAEGGCILNGAQVALGLLLLSIVAPTALAEERVRGRLDVLMTTPLSTASIVWGKWWGAFRPVPLLTVLPWLVAAVMYVSPQLQPGPAGTDGMTPRWIPLVLLPTLILAYGAALTSLGLALATWSPRVGWAVAATVGAYVSMTFGWFILMMTVAENNYGAAAAIGSPFVGGAVNLVFMIDRGPRNSMALVLGWDVSWILFYCSVAAGLLLATMRTFGRCLSRMPETSVAPPAPRPKVLVERGGAGAAGASAGGGVRILNK